MENAAKFSRGTAGFFVEEKSLVRSGLFFVGEKPKGGFCLKFAGLKKTLNMFFLSDLHKGAHQFEINLFQCCLQIEDVKHFVILMCVCFEQLELRDCFFSSS